MKVEILYFDGCPTYKATEKTLRKVIYEEAIDAEIQLVAVNKDEEAQRVRFPGSPRSGWTARTCSPPGSARTGG